MKLKNVIILLMASLSFLSCKTDTFADYVDAENEAVDKYFKDINAVIVHEKPETVSGEWLDSNNRKIFYRIIKPRIIFFFDFLCPRHHRCYRPSRKILNHCINN